MIADGCWRFNLRTAIFIIFLTFLPLNLNSKEIAEVFDSSQDHFLIQSGVYDENRRSLSESLRPGNNPAVEALPPSPQSSKTFKDPSPPPSRPRGEESRGSPPDGEPTQTPTTPPIDSLSMPPPPPQPPSPTPLGAKKKSPNVYMIVGIVVGVSTISAALIIFFLIFSRKIPIKPWTNSSQLQDALISDISRLQLSELRTACEDFSNIIGSFSDGAIYKGTLSTGAEIAVVSIAAGSRADWSNAKETQLLQKMHKLSKVDHKNFLNLIGYCHEDEPFNRMLVFEYAPNGSLFEHLHSHYVEHLDWPTRLRIIMGISYCLEHMHNLNPPILQASLTSSSVFLTEDNAAKVSEFSVIDSLFPSNEGSSSKSLLEPSILDPQTNVFSFGAIVFEIISGKFPDPDSLFLEPKPAVDIVDPTVKVFQEDVVERMLEVVRQCMNPYSAQRPTMREVVMKLSQITGIQAEAAMPRQSPRWWAELEIISTEGN